MVAGTKSEVEKLEIWERARQGAVYRSDIQYSAEPRWKRAPIDLFFRSLAERHEDGCAVILTGAGPTARSA
jgi:two-component system CheB/CheR fusion protein